MDVKGLSIQEVGDIPLREVSGLGQRRAPARAGLEVLAVGDEQFTVVAATRPGPGRAWAFESFALERVMAEAEPSPTSEWEAADGDSSGKVFILQESPGRVFVLDADLGELVHTIDLQLDPGAVAGLDWADAENSQGEGLVLLRNGHVLVAKEKDPPLLMEFGPAGDRATGVAPELLFSTAAEFPLPPARRARFDLLRVWPLGAETSDRIRDISDIAVGPDDHLYLLSDESRCIARAEPGLGPGEEHLDVVALWELPGELRQPEGLVVTDELVPIVAIDRQESGRNLFVLDPLDG